MKKILILLVFTPWLCAAQIYKWVDENGKVHYSDKPFENQKGQVLDAEKLQRSINSVSFVSVEILPAEFITNQQTQQVIMYATRRCGYCAKARRYFKENGINYIEKDIDLSAEARLEFDRVGGKGVPLIFVGKYKVSGFNKSRFAKVYNEVFNPIARERLDE